MKKIILPTLGIILIVILLAFPDKLGQAIEILLNFISDIFMAIITPLLELIAEIAQG